MPKEATSEAHLSAERPQAGKTTRVPSPHVDKSGPSGDPQPPAEGPRPAVRVIRMHGRENFLDVRQHGFRARSGPIGVSYVARVSGAPAQVGYAITQRVGNAVVRNRLRRRLRAALTELARVEHPTLRGGLYVINPSPAAVPLSFTQLGSALRTALDKVVARADVIDARR